MKVITEENSLPPVLNKNFDQEQKIPGNDLNLKLNELEPECQDTLRILEKGLSSVENLVRNLKNCKTTAEFKKDIKLNLPVAMYYLESVSKEDQLLKKGLGID